MNGILGGMRTLGRPNARKIAEAGMRAVGQLPLLRGPLMLAYQRYFNAARGQDLRLFNGIYPSFKAAERAIPPGRLIGYDNAPSARRVAHHLFRVFPWDYPLMFWLERLLPECRLLFDWGGNIGISFFAFRKHLRYPDDLKWLVCDVPAVVAEGVDTARRHHAPGLDFTTSLERLSDADILLAAGTVQFIEDPFGLLAAQRTLPRHLLLNKVPVYSLPSAVTLQNMGTAMLPNHLFQEAQLFASLQSLGYRIVDEWDVAVSCQIPFYPEHSIDSFKGYYLVRGAAVSGSAV